MKHYLDKKRGRGENSVGELKSFDGVRGREDSGKDEVVQSSECKDRTYHPLGGIFGWSTWRND